MNDIELQALAVLAQTEARSMQLENENRLFNQFSIVYSDVQITGLDSVRALNHELRRRGLLEDPKVTAHCEYCPGVDKPHGPHEESYEDRCKRAQQFDEDLIKAERE